MSSAGTTSELDVSTTKLGNTTFTFNSSAKTFKYLDYPGGLAVIGADVLFSKEKDESDKNEYTATFDLKITYTNETNTALPWKLYVLDKTDFDESDSKMDPQCKLKNYFDAGANKTYFWYGNDDNTTGATAYQTDSCNLSADIQAALDEQTKLIAEGILTAGKSSLQGLIDSTTEVSGEDGQITKKGDVAKDDTHPLAGRVMNTDDINAKYYYLIVEYPNSSDQTADKGSAINVKLEAENIVSAVKAG